MLCTWRVKGMCREEAEKDILVRFFPGAKRTRHIQQNHDNTITTLLQQLQQQQQRQRLLHIAATPPPPHPLSLHPFHFYSNLRQSTIPSFNSFMVLFWIKQRLIMFTIRFYIVQ